MIASICDIVRTNPDKLQFVENGEIKLAAIFLHIV